MGGVGVVGGEVTKSAATVGSTLPAAMSSGMLSSTCPSV